MFEDKMPAQSADTTNPGAFTLCPHVSSPFADCYCADMTSTRIPLALAYCCGNHANCQVYLRHRLLAEP